jgi:thiol-disulfide isomerase/thioredoxin
MAAGRREGRRRAVERLLREGGGWEVLGGMAGHVFDLPGLSEEAQEAPPCQHPLAPAPAPAPAPDPTPAPSPPPVPAPPRITQLTTKSELDSLRSSSPPPRLVVVWFTASWCGVCRKAERSLTKLAETPGHASFAKVDVDEAHALVEQFGVSALPHFALVPGGKGALGKPLASLVGAKTTALRKMIEKHAK